MNKDNNDNGKTSATALFYDGENSPTITAQGLDDLAEEIIRVAREHNIPLYENPQLAAILSTMDLGDSIPESLYLAIAEIIAFAYTLQGKFPSDWAED